MQTGVLFDIQRFSLHDGPGIRTTVFFKGCNLRCRWCHNPESQSPKPELMLYPDKCVGCGKCAGVCAHPFDRKSCTGCGRCADVCANGARELSGYRISADEVVKKALRDLPYYRQSGGGVTLSGGEPLMQPDFAEAILSGLKDADVQTAIETAANVPTEVFQRILPLTDLILCDVKCADPLLHRQLTGVDNALILQNIRYLKENAPALRFRMPYIPGLNSDEAEAVKAICGDRELELMAYHTIGVSKYAALGRRYETDAPVPTQTQMRSAAAHLNAVFTPSGF
ncbi:MAG: glycyl-radical enzyme activating protein [Clostridia bacterium]|nr:glycyl-radical enzyme activating protein [Clostridia bacterium]